MANKIQLDTLSGQEFKDLIELVNNNGKIGSLVELLNMVRNIPDNVTFESYIESVVQHAAIDEETLKRIVREVVDEKEAEGQLTEDDIENIFFPPEVTAITVSGHTIAATAENIDDDEAVTWVLDIDGTESEVDGTGTTLTLDEPMQAAYDAAASVTVRLICSDYESGTYTLKAE